jgi:REP element-mobilizing transposase RayT
MPDHLHLLVEGTHEDSDLKAFVARAKQYSGFYFRQQTRIEPLAALRIRACAA